MRHLRLKIEENPAEPKRILTAAGVGYRVAP
jgi:DNA-binding response OmpR family regulator